MSKTIRLQIITPQKPVLDKQVDFVALPAFEGELGVLPNHEPYITKLNFGTLRYKIGTEEHTFAIMEGIAEIANNEVSVFAEDAALQEEINEEEVRQKLEKAKDSLQNKDKSMDFEEAEKEIKKALLMLKVKSRKK